MREILVEVVSRLGSVPDRAAELVRLRAETSDQLHKALDLQKQAEVQVAGQVATEKGTDGKPLYPNEACRNAEIQRRLNEMPDWKLSQGVVDKYRKTLRDLDAEIEAVQRRHRSDVALVGLVTALLNAGMTEDAEALVQAYAGNQNQQENRDEQEVLTEQPKQDDGLEVITARVLEARNTKADTVRAYCETDKGKVAVYAKNGIGTALLQAVGKEIMLQAKKLDKGYFAVKVA